MEKTHIFAFLLILMALTRHTMAKSELHFHELSDPTKKLFSKGSLALGAGYLIQQSFLANGLEHSNHTTLASMAAIVGASYLMYARKHRVSFNPHATYFDGLPSQQKTLSVFMTGWGDTRNAMLRYRLTTTLPGTILTFNLPDSPAREEDVGTRSVKHLFHTITQTNWGQLHDVLITIKLIKAATLEQSPERIILYGYSRGGGLLVNMIAVLKDGSQQKSRYRKDLAHINVTKQECKRILALIESGGIILDCPLGNANTAITEIMPLPRIVTRNVARLITRYSPECLHADSSAEMLAGLKLTSLIFFCKKDVMVGGQKRNKKLCTALHKHNPSTTHIFEHDIDAPLGGHLHDKVLMNQYIRKYFPT